MQKDIESAAASGGFFRSGKDNKQIDNSKPNLPAANASVTRAEERLRVVLENLANINKKLTQYDIIYKAFSFNHEK